MAIRASTPTHIEWISRFRRPSVAIDLINPYDQTELVFIKKIRDRFKQHVTVSSYKDLVAVNERRL